MKKRYYITGISIVTVAAVAFAPWPLYGIYSSSTKCLCGTTHYLVINNGHIGNMSSWHKEGIYYGGVTRTGLWKYSWELQYTYPKDKSTRVGTIYSFPFFIVFERDGEKTHIECRLPFHGEIHKHVGTAVIEKYVYETNDSGIVDTWDTEFKYIERREFGNRKASNQSPK